MNVDGAWKCYEEFTGKVSDLTRQLAFAGIAVVWIFKDDTPVPATGQHPLTLMPRDLVLAIGFFVLALIFDYLQYISASVVWRLYARSKDKAFKRLEITPETDFSQPDWISLPYTPFFWLKIIALGFGQIVLFFYLAHRWALLA